MSLLVAAVGFGGPKVNLSGGTNNHTTLSPTDPAASFRLHDDGNMYERDGSGSFVQINDVTDWVRPTSAASLFEWRWTNATGDTGDVLGTTAEDTWTTNSLVVTVSRSSTGTSSVTFDFQIRYIGSSTVLESGSYTLTAIEDI